MKILLCKRINYYLELLFFLLVLIFPPLVYGNPLNTTMSDKEWRDTHAYFYKWSKVNKTEYVIETFLKYIKDLKCEDKLQALETLQIFVFELEDSLREYEETGECNLPKNHVVSVHYFYKKT